MIKKELDKYIPLLTKSELIECTLNFKKDLIASLSNQRSSLPCILNPISRMTPKKGNGVAVSIGGTNGYVSYFEVSNRGIVRFVNRVLFSIPSTVSKADLFHLITKNILKAVGNKSKNLPIGIGLAYPLKPILHHGFIDGELMHMAKGRDIDGLVGKKVGQEYHKFLIKEYRIDTVVAVANDAICLLLGGESASIAGVVGTGLNFAYWEKRTSIAPLKLSELFGFGHGEVAVNVEAKDFDKIEGNKLRDIVDKNSTSYGKALAEKEAAGAYLYQIFNAGIDKIIGGSFSKLMSTDELNEIITGGYKYNQNQTEKEKDISYLFSERIYHRSAQIVAVELSGIMTKIGQTKGIVSVVMEGSVFWKAHNFPALVNLYLNMILPEIIPSFARLFGSSRKGIAILASGS